MSNIRRNKNNRWHKLFTFMRKRNQGKLKLSRADLSDANLSDADLYNADLSDADLRDATMNWLSHDLIAERLHQAAGDDILLRLAAGHVIMSRDLCHAELIKYAPDIPHPEHGTVMQWALGQMLSWHKEGDDFPSILEHAYKSYRKMEN